MATTAETLTIDSSWVVWASYLANRRAVERNYFIPANLGERTVYADSPRDAKSRASVWETNVRKLREMEINPIVYAPNLFRNVREDPDQVFPEPTQLASRHYVELVQRDPSHRVQSLRIGFETDSSKHCARACSAARSHKISAADAIFSESLDDQSGYSGVFKFCIVHEYNTEVMRQRARKYFLDEASQDLFTFWDAYQLALGELLPECLITDAPGVYIQVLKRCISKIEAERRG